MSAAPIAVPKAAHQQRALLTVDEVATMLQLSRGWSAITQAAGAFLFHAEDDGCGEAIGLLKEIQPVPKPLVVPLSASTAPRQLPAALQFRHGARISGLRVVFWATASVFMARVR